MPRMRYLSFFVVASILCLSARAQQNSTQATVSSVVTCVSSAGQRQHCAANTNAGIVMLRQSSETSCLLGRNWGYDAEGVWVSEGCGGEFGTGSTERSAATTAEVDTVAKSGDQELATVTTGTNPEVNYTGMFNPYASLRNIVSISDGTATVQDNASRIGINLSTFGPIKVFGTGEWGVNLVRSETTFNAGATTAEGFGTISQDTTTVFGARLGFLGVDLGKFGRLSFGKQNSTHYDIAQYTTDRFNVFGGQSTTTYVAGTDGGQSGTGRADQTILYHVKVAMIDFGAQGQLRTGSTPQAFNGFGFSLQGDVLPGLKIGGAYNKTYLNPQLTNVVFNGGGTDYWTLGGKGNWRILEWGAVWARQNNGDVAFVPNPTGGAGPLAVGFSASGVEIYSRLHFGKFAFVGGFEDYIPRDLNPLINGGFKTRYAILGGEWHISKSGYAFLDSRLGDSVDATGTDVANALAIGFRYDFNWKTSHTE